MKHEREDRSASIQALRGIAFLGIFLVHAGAPIEWSRLGVAVFFVLSGFLLEKRHGKDVRSNSFRASFRFMLERLKRLYPLHILTMLAALLLALAVLVKNGFPTSEVRELVAGLLANIALIQAWFPAVSISLNSVAWYLSVICFLYFLFPWLSAGVHRIKARGGRIACGAWILLVLAAQILFATVVFGQYPPESGAASWATYTFPLYRTGDFFVGCLWAHILTEEVQPTKISTASWTLLESLTLAGIIGIYFWIKQPHRTLLGTALANQTTLWIVAALALCSFFTLCRGGVSKLCTNPFLVSLGNLSAYAFLIHNIVTAYVNTGLKVINITPGPIMLWVKVAAELALTIVVTLLYMKLRERRHRQRVAH